MKEKRSKSLENLDNSTDLLKTKQNKTSFYKQDTFNFNLLQLKRGTRACKSKKKKRDLILISVRMDEAYLKSLNIRMETKDPLALRDIE